MLIHLLLQAYEHQVYGLLLSLVMQQQQLQQLMRAMSHGQVSLDHQHLLQTMSLVVYVCSKSDVRVDMVVAVMPIPMDESIYQIVRHLQLTLHLHEVSIHPIFTAMMLLETGRWPPPPIAHHTPMRHSRYESSTLPEPSQQ